VPRENLVLDGAAQLDAQLAVLGEAVATEIGRDAAIASAEALKEAWVMGAPYSLRSSTVKYWSKADGSTGKRDYGHLRDNIKVAPVRAQKINAVVYKVTTGNAFWGYFLEFGTVRMPPHPWARPIVEWMKDALINVQIDVLREGIEAIAGETAAAVTRQKWGPVLPSGRNG
jgi:HK97 gp10 family phage protein